MNEIERDFEDFVRISTTAPEAPSLASLPRGNEILSVISPSPLTVFAKLTCIVSLVGVLNLLLCPQFGFGLTRGIGLLEFFMLFGHTVCKILCGFLFFGTGVGAAALVLSPFDLTVIRQHQWLHLSGLSALLLIFFVAAGAAVYFSAALAWLVGGMFGAALSLSVGTALRLSRRPAVSIIGP